MARFAAVLLAAALLAVMSENLLQMHPFHISAKDVDGYLLFGFRLDG
jgi:hypothetical protein